MTATSINITETQIGVLSLSIIILYLFLSLNPRPPPALPLLVLPLGILNDLGLDTAFFIAAFLSSSFCSLKDIARLIALVLSSKSSTLSFASLLKAFCLSQLS